jgi:hypothetical protein
MKLKFGYCVTMAVILLIPGYGGRAAPEPAAPPVGEGPGTGSGAARASGELPKPHPPSKSRPTAEPPAPSPSTLFRGEREDEDRTRVKLMLAAVGPQRADRVAVKLTVTNQGDSPIVWDRDFCCFLKWHVKREDWTEIEPKHIKDDPAPTPGMMRERFVTLAPGESLSSGEILLSQSIKVLSSGRGTLPGGAHVAVGSEERVRFEVPKSSKCLTVGLEYSVDNDDKGGFFSVFGRTVDEAKLPQGHYKATSLRRPAVNAIPTIYSSPA